MSAECDLLVIGSGAAGLSAAVTAAHHGLRVIVVEKDAVLGGTSAWSGGWIWAPGNPVCARTGTVDSLETAETYLRAVLGNHFDAPRVHAFLTHAPRMVAFFETHTALTFEPGSQIPDTYGHLPGAGTGGRSVIAVSYDGRALGPLMRLLRPPLRETSFLGLTIQAGADLRAFMTMTRQPRAFAYVIRRMARHLWDLGRHGRAMQLRNGSALVARLMRSAADLGVEFRTDSPALRLLIEDGRVTGAVVAAGGAEQTIRATRGVVLASGGFPQDSARRAAQFPQNDTHVSLAVPTATGDGLRMAEAVGARQGETASPGAWCPVSQVRWPDGRQAPFPHIIERGKPGVIAVLPNGQRFCNEGLGYHDFVEALLRNTPPGQPPEAWLIATRAFQRRYGLGISRPFPLPLRPWLRRGYLKSGQTPEALAKACGIDPAGLRATLDDWNRHAAKGEDPAFHRGTTPYMRLQGDASHGPNPCVAPIDRPPYLAVKVIPGSFGTFAGLETDAAARVLQGGAPIPGLYAAGTDMASVMGGFYPAGGINLGPALTFGHIAALHAAGALENAT
ncbi:FAD-dependent oxidoreductase [Frigidibacter albus]|uniref:FAD-dependent oxidoreductase n=1 Tax=Frigidibacter albus TaxID=1465486 RepID=A0A6L8VK10_9RHOB|nr:FAD-dependent oxidoreductase [Frigidibacter albus]MZQ90543.1 FAD-dependent oxidoreductase [Frigidibacter albus]NBE32337.1 FAD-dependent oxidoreductase [Frigidibacter albus]GGH59240.1 FAD-binding dehydrogenase [Frigidibacter albus]